MNRVGEEYSNLSTKIIFIKNPASGLTLVNYQVTTRHAPMNLGLSSIIHRPTSLRISATRGGE